MAEEVKRIRAVFEADVSKYNTSLDSINKQMKLSRAETRLAQKELQGFGTNSETVARVQEKLNQQLELNRKKIELYNQSLTKSQQIIDKNVASREGLNQKVVEAKKALAEAEKAHGKESEATKKASEALDEAKKAYDKNESAINSNIKKIAEYETQISSAKTEILGLENQIEYQNKALQEQANKLKATSEKLSEFGDRAKSAGDSINNVSNKVLSVSASMATIIGASAAMSLSFEKDIAKINTLLDDTRNLDKYKNKVKELSDETGIQIGTVSEGMYQAISSLGDLGEETNTIFEIMTKGAKAGSSEVSDAVSLIAAGMKGYGQINAETAKKISDLAFQTAKLGVTTFPEMASSMQELFPLSSTLNISLEELYGNMATLTGVTGNTAEVSTQLKAVFSNLIKPTTAMQKLIEKYGHANAQAMLETEGFSGLLKILQEETGGSSDKMGELFSSTEALTAILALTGEQYDTFIDKTGQMEEAAGATQRALDKIESTKADKLEKSLNRLKNSFIKLGEESGPLVDKFASILEKVTDAISEMDEETLDSIINLTMMGVAVGGAGKVVGGTVSTVGDLAKGLSTLTGWLGKTSGAATAVGTATAAAGGSAGMGMMVTTLGSLVSAAAPWLLAAAGIVGFGVAINNEMSQEVIPTMDLFEDALIQTGTAMTANGEVATYMSQKISEETKKQVQSYLDLDEQAKFALNDLYFSSQTITDETVNNMTEKYRLMGETITAGLAENKANDTEILSQFFATSTLMTEEQEAEILRLMQEGYDNKQTTVQEAETRINEILTAAKDANRELKAEEVEEITTLQNQMKTEAIKALSTQEQEAQVILDRLSAYDKRVTAEMVSEHIKKLNEQEQSAIDSANNQYRETVNAIETMRDELGVITAEQADSMIEDAERQRDETIKAAEKTRDSAVDTIFKMNKDLVEDVDASTGNIISFWDRLFGKWDRWQPQKKTFVTENKTIETIEKKTNYYETKRPGYLSPINLERQIYKQLSRSIPQQVSFAQSHSNLSRQQPIEINYSPELIGTIQLDLGNGRIEQREIRFIDKGLKKKQELSTYGGIR